MKKAKQGNWLVALSMLLSSSWAHADWTVNMREGVTAISRDVYSLHMIIFWVCVVIGVLVFGVMILSMLMHQSRWVLNRRISTTVQSLKLSGRSFQWLFWS